MFDPAMTGQEQSRRRGGCRRAALIAGVVIAGLVVIIVIIALAAGSGQGDKTGTAPASSSPAKAAGTASPPPSPAAVPSPDGTFQGSCDYTLGDSPATGTAAAVGDIDAKNTGNIGIVVKLTITWPQEGYAPLTMSKTVRIPSGGEQDPQFHRPLSYDQITRLQSYQAGHGYADGCTYHGEITGTFGQPR